MCATPGRLRIYQRFLLTRSILLMRCSCSYSGRLQAAAIDALFATSVPPTNSHARTHRSKVRVATAATSSVPRAAVSGDETGTAAVLRRRGRCRGDDEATMTITGKIDEIEVAADIAAGDEATCTMGDEVLGKSDDGQCRRRLTSGIDRDRGGGAYGLCLCNYFSVLLSF